MSAPIRWRGHLAAALIVTVLTHVLTVWAIPRVIMDRIIAIGTNDTTMERSNGVSLPRPTDHSQRRIVMPSPDLLYATCFFDVSAQSLRVTFASDYPRYWSIALYASTSDNFFVVNDRGAVNGGVDLQIVGSGIDAKRKAVLARKSTVIVAPTNRGMLLMRLLVNDDPAVLAAAEAARRQLRCEPAA